ncbi:Transcriptional activator spt7 [Saxophila tyrrhenica]|uniref:SAGA complex subunit Spt7 n=1 Tax=Saxophila tyrrhenica TaxID=1690608 RepID=A0AAV9PK36_9PEZI|nr:Transcriptional activator spt7 [Saxophila tyrrhenica]
MSQDAPTSTVDGDVGGGPEDLLKSRWAETEANIAKLFGTDGQTRRTSQKPTTASEAAATTTTSAPDNAKTPAPPKRSARHIDDDYGDDDDEDEEDSPKESPLRKKAKIALPNGIHPLAARSPLPAGRALPRAAPTSTPSEPAKSSEDVRKQLEEDKRTAEEAATKSFQSMYYTFEHDKDAMVEQQKLDELDREVENELSGGATDAPNAQQGAGAGPAAASTQGTLGSADLGASSLTLKHLIARIDMKRDMVRASDNQLRTLISEVRKGRSKWASEDKVGQEELYEAAEKVLMELKAQTDYAQPFLQRVSKREAPDYFNVIKHPMDIGTMLKKLKQLGYRSKRDFVDDLNLIWANCLKYNQDPQHPLRKKALYMRKETDKLTPLIPDILVRDRAEVEAEERRLHSIDADESDEDDAPIMASRGRKAPKKGGSKGGPTSTKRAPTVAVEEAGSATPAPDMKPPLPLSATNLRTETLRAESEVQDASSAGFSTPPPGNATPLGVNGVNGSGAPGSQADVTEVDGLGNSVVGSTPEDEDEEDTEFKTWKQVTKRDRAQAAADRHRLFRGEQLKNLNPEEPALIRTKAMMRRWTRQQMAASGKPSGQAEAGESAEEPEQPAQGESLAEGIEKDQDSTLPDYYSSLSAIPELDERFRWTTDSEGAVVPQTEEWMRMYPKEQFKSADGALNRKIEDNMRQMQDTRKICAKIGVVKQMQIQAQTYQNQFTKYEVQPFIEQDVGAVVVSEDGPLMAPWVSRAALQRSVGKIFYHAGFEDFQPSALEMITDLAGEYFGKLVDAFKSFREQPKAEPETSRYSYEEQVLHSLHEHGLDLEALETYVKDDVERLSTKLGVVHDRMRSHLADLLRPALGDHAGADGVGAFNDGSEQFVGGDFAEDLDEDFFGFRELGLAEELGLENLSVPLHLLQNRMHSAYQAAHQGPASTTGLVFPQPDPYEPITIDNVGAQVGLVQDFFREKLHANHEDALVEDEDLPQKQRFPKPRLPPTGKISSPRKRPIREQQQAAKKKRKMEESGKAGGVEVAPIGKLKLEASVGKGVNGVQEPEKKREKGGEEMEVDREVNGGGGEVNGGAGGGTMISPESLAPN